MRPQNRNSGRCSKPGNISTGQRANGNGRKLKAKSWRTLFQHLLTLIRLYYQAKLGSFTWGKHGSKYRRRGVTASKFVEGHNILRGPLVGGWPSRQGKVMSVKGAAYSLLLPAACGCLRGLVNL